MSGVLSAPFRGVAEAQRLLALAKTREERVSVAKFLGSLYAARVAPFETFGCSTTVKLQGLTWHLGVRTSEIYIFEEIYTHAMYDRLPQYVAGPDWFVVDAGANVGVFTVTAASRGAYVVAVEPNQECFERLVRNVRTNNLATRVRPVNAALGDRVGVGAMVVHGGGTTGGVVVEANAEEASPAPWVRLCTLDELLLHADTDRIDLLKLDVEGAEVMALEGGGRTLARTDRVILEYHSPALLDGVRDVLERHGFVEDLQFVYMPENRDTGEDEVGMLYASRPDID